MCCAACPLRQWNVLRATLASAAVAGLDQARVELAVYGLPNTVTPYRTEQELAVAMAQYDAQALAVQATWATTGRHGADCWGWLPCGLLCRRRRFGEGRAGWGLRW